MRPAPALTQPAALAALVRELESEGQVLDVPEGLGAALAIGRPAQDDPGQRVGLLVADEEASGGANRRWLRENESDLAVFCRSSRIARCTVIFPGGGLHEPERRRLARTSIRPVSAPFWLWVDKLRVIDDHGRLDTARRQVILRRLGARWSADDDREYTDPALAAVGDTSAAKHSLALLSEGKTDLETGLVTVLYGPGGIGKTFFLRRLAHEATREALKDPTVGIPVFAELPALLHADALENWLGRTGLRLPVGQLSGLIHYGVIIPVLDALDEMIRGQARDGTREFLRHLAELAPTSGRILLSSRDYFLNLDPMVREVIDEPLRAELSVGYFAREDRRRYVQLRAGLEGPAAARWAAALEEQAKLALEGAPDDDLDSLIGHPVFLDAFCNIILDHPAERRTKAADSFRITSPDVFGDIVGHMLRREHDKLQPRWDEKFAGRFSGAWAAPYTPARQLAVFRELVLTVAADGGAEALRRAQADPRYRDLRHGAFTFTRGMAGDEDGAHSALKHFLRRQLGELKLADDLPEEEAQKVAEEALNECASAFRGHPISDTRPENPDDLVLATRNRAYFDFLLASALLERLSAALSGQDPVRREEFILWCLDHHIFERDDEASEEPPFGGCLDFVTWHRDSALRALQLIDEMFFEDEAPDATVASYVVSLALAVLLRAAARSGRALIQDRVLSVEEGSELEIVSSVVPVISGCRVQRSSLPRLRLAELRLIDDVGFDECDLEALLLEDCVLRHVSMIDTEVGRLVLRGDIGIADSRLDLEVEAEQVVIDSGAQIAVRDSELSQPLYEALEVLARSRPDRVKLAGVSAIEAPPGPIAMDRGQFFVNKLMSLARRHGHDEFAVYSPKLRGRTPTTTASFPAALKVLESHGTIFHKGQMVCLTAECEQHRYSGKGLPGLRTYEDVRDYWEPVVQELDAVL